MIVDTSAIFAAMFEGEAHHDDVVGVLSESDEPLVVSPLVLAELDYLVQRRHGVGAELEILADFASGAWQLATVAANDVGLACAIIRSYRDMPVGLADAMNVVLADRYRTRTIATLDRRHFTVLRLADGTAPVLVP